MPNFGPLVNLALAAESLIAYVDQWLPSYLSQAEEESGYLSVGEDAGGWERGATPPPASYFTRSTLEAIPGEDRLPAVILVVRDSDKPKRKGDGTYDVDLNMGLAAITSGQDARNARENAGLYGAALVGLMVRKPNFDGLMDNKLRFQEWAGMNLDDLPVEDARSLAIVRMGFTLKVIGVAQMGIGPASPPEDPKQPTPPNSVVRSVYINDVLVTEEGSES